MKKLRTQGIEDKDVIFAMALDKKKCRIKLDGLSHPLIDHIAKIIIYGNNGYSECVNGWIGDAAKAIHNASRVKAKNLKLTKEDYEKYLFGELGDNDSNDAEVTLACVESYHQYKHKNPMDPVDITPEMVRDMMTIGDAIRDDISERLAATSDPISIKEAVGILRPYFAEFI